MLMLTFIYNNLLGLFMGQTYKCHKSGLSFDSYQELKNRRKLFYPLDYVHGKPFFMCEVSLNKGQVVIYDQTKVLDLLEE